jgi:3-oxoacyl-[acyl-carrier-protein] synthase II
VRQGWICVGEGGAQNVLEEYEYAKARGAKIYAEVAVLCMSADAFPYDGPLTLTVPVVSTAMALRNAEVNADEVGYPNAHGTSTSQGLGMRPPRNKTVSETTPVVWWSVLPSQ